MAPAPLYSLAELLLAKEHDLYWRQERLTSYAQSNRVDAQRLQQMQDSLDLDAAVVTYLHQLNQPFLVSTNGEGRIGSYEVIADDVRALRLDPHLGYLDVAIRLGNPGTARARLHLDLLEGC